MPQWVFSTSAGNTCTHMRTYEQGHADKWKHMELHLWDSGFVLLGFNSNSLSTHLFITSPKQVCFYLVAVYTLHNERNDFVCYSETLQDWMHCCVCREVRTIQYTDNKHLHNPQPFFSSCLSKTYGGGKALTLQHSFQTLVSQTLKTVL